LFKASIALVLVAFAALAYGWIAGNDTILYGSIGASALAGLALLASQRRDRKARPATAVDPEREERPERPRREPRGRAALGEDSPGQRRAAGRLDSADVTRQLDISDDDDDDQELERPPAVRKVVSPPAGRPRGTRAPKGAAWATEDDLDAELEEEDYDIDQASRGSGFQEEADDEEAGEPAARTGQVAAADDFRSRLAAVLGPAEAQEEAAPAPRPKPARARRTAPAATPEAETPKPRRGRKKAAAPPETETEGGATEPEPDWVRIDDVPRISRATQPGGGFARPDAPQGLTPYRPRRPAVSPESSGEGAAKAPAARRKSNPADKAGATKPRSTAAKRSTAAGKPAAAGDEAAPKRSTSSKSAVTSVSGTTKPRTRTPKDRDPDAPPPRRGRPPKPKP